MKQLFNVYCDESCHLENDAQKIMVLGAIWLPKNERINVTNDLKQIKKKHNLNRKFEVKWTKISPAKIQFYIDYINYFFENDNLNFRVIVCEKTNLNHNTFRQTHDEWYYKMYFTMLKNIFDPESSYNVYIDIKDTLGQAKVEKLHNVLSNNIYDFSKEIICKLQQVHSHESEILQLADILIGAVSYFHRGFNSSTAKNTLVKCIQDKSRYNLIKNTLPQAKKFNLFIWKGETDCQI
ncbi:DUF3800 domain-containing protein [Thiotrichales bacterium 19S3-7]|nr:DUF3800 domain-containing protein [Thiotrichales bacterium 19S3-7]MCF6802549.1 DUF3800 domain-containing protein [Thiotrichales bacterium 19S3-11]